MGNKRKLSAWQIHVKNVMARYPKLSFKEALRKAKQSYGRKTLTRTNPKRGKRGNPNRMAKRKGGTRRRFSLPLAPILGVAGTLLGGSNVGPQHTTIAHLQRGDWAGAGTRAVANVTGYNMQTGSFNWREINILPTLVGAGVHILASMLGVNRYLARSRVPFIRI